MAQNHAKAEIKEKSSDLKCTHTLHTCALKFYFIFNYNVVICK